MHPDGGVVYEARFGWNARSGSAITASAFFVAIGIFVPMSVALRVVDFAFFGGGGVLAVHKFAPGVPVLDNWKRTR